jgi:membrane protease YdiL (CAAX protease family)
VNSAESLARDHFSKRAAAVEIAVILTLIYFYIWILVSFRNYTIDVLAYLSVLLVVCLLQTLHRLPLKVQGLRLDNFVRSLKPVAIFTLMLTLALIILALLWVEFTFRPEMFLRSWWFLLWGPIQQFLLQSVLQLRVRSIVNSRFGRIFVSSLIFSLVHLPNYYLMVFSFVGGLCWCYLFARHPDIFALGLSHALVDLTLLVIFPPELLGNLRVGPGFLGGNRSQVTGNRR